MSESRNHNSEFLGVSWSDLRSRVVDCERRFPVATWEIDGIQVWPLIRLDVYMRGLRTDLPGGTARDKRAALARAAQTVLSTLRASLLDRAHADPADQPADLAVFASSHGRQWRCDQRWYHVFFDPLLSALDSMGRRAVLFETAQCGVHVIPRYGRSRLVSVPLVGAHVASRLTRRPAVKIHLPGFDGFVRHLRSLALDTPYCNPMDLARDVHQVRSNAALFHKWLQPVRPRVAAVNCACRTCASFLLAARQLGALTVELQHGLQDDDHLAYGSWTAVPPGGYNTRPDLFWCWDERSAACINRWSEPMTGQAAAFVGGNPLYAILAGAPAPALAAADEEIRAAAASLPKLPKLLVTLSYLGPPLPAPVLETLRRLRDEVVVCIRPHPHLPNSDARHLTQTLREGAFHAFPVDLVRRLPFPFWLREADCHLDIQRSTTVLEAETFGIRSVTLCAEARNSFPGQVASGQLTVAETPDEAAWAVRRAVALPRSAPTYRIQPVAEVLSRLFALTENRGPQASEVSCAQ